MKTLLIAILGTILAILIALYIYVSTQLDPKEIRLNVLQKIEKHFPNTKAEMGDLAIEVGQSLELKSNLLKFSSKEKIPLLEIKNISVKIPLLSILLGGGNVEIDIFNPSIYYFKEGKSSNWSKALEGHSANDFIQLDNPKELVIPAFLANSTFALRLHDSEIKYKRSSLDPEQRMIVSKFVLKNVGINSNAAFELKSDFTFPMKNNDILQFHSFIVGSINLSDYMNTKNLPIKSTYKIDGIGIKGKSDLFPMINGSIDAQLNQNGELSLKNSLRGEKSHLKHLFEMNKKEIRVKDLNATIFLSELNPLLRYFNFPLDIASGELLVKGKLSADKEGYYPELEANIKDVRGKLTNSDYSSNVEVRLNQENAEVKGRANLYGGSITWESNLKYSLNDNTDLDRRIKSLNTIIKMADLKLTSESLRKIIIRNEKKEKEEGKGDEVLLPFFFVLPNSMVNAELVNSKFDEKNISFDAKVKTNKGASKIDNMKLEFGDGSLTINGEAKLYEDGVNTKWKVNLKDFSSGILKPFLREDEPFLLGDFNGLINGPFSIKNGKKVYDFKIDLKSKKGKLLGINLNEEFTEIKDEIHKIPLLGKDIQWTETKISNDYKDVVFNAVARDGVLNIKNTRYQSSDGVLRINTAGKIFLESSKESLIEGNVYDKVGISDYLKTKLAMKSIPIALRGPGREVKVDHDYTISKFTEHLNSKEGKKKVEKVIDENVDKYIKGDSGKQIKKLLKGFLK